MSRGKVAGCPYQKLRLLQKSLVFSIVDRSSICAGADLRRYQLQMRTGFATEALNDRQIEVINRMLDGFEGKLTSSKWASLAKCSQDTAYRDILDLMERGILKKNPEGGRSTSYDFADI